MEYTLFGFKTTLSPKKLRLNLKAILLLLIILVTSLCVFTEPAMSSLGC